MKNELNPCKLCGGIATEIGESKSWNGKSYRILSFTLKHWCEPLDPSLRGFIEIKGYSKDSLIEYWNS